ncbi:MAG: uroporphyrinogen decarboxylase family protein [Armatimonadota bacterium]
MTSKERFMNTLLFKAVDHVPNMEICLWTQTRDRWLAEGMPTTVNTGFMHRGDRHFGLEGYETVHVDVLSPIPSFDGTVLEEDEETVLFLDGYGRTRRAYKPGTAGGTRMSMDTYLDFAVKDFSTWDAFQPRYEGPVAERYPADWEAMKGMAQTTNLPLTLLNPLAGTFGYYSMLRNWMGTENLSYLFYDNTPLVEACLEFLTEHAIRVLTPAMEQIKFDFYYIHEDMSYKNGPLVSPEMFRRLFLPHYKRLIAFLRRYGVELILVDTDGNCEVLLPLFIEADVDGFGPVERAAEMDPLDIRKKFGKEICMVGGVDKREIAKGKREIEAEITRLAPVVEEGGFIPTIDHSIPPDVSLENFEYYLKVKCAVLGL